MSMEMEFLGEIYDWILHSRIQEIKEGFLF